MIHVKPDNFKIPIIIPLPIFVFEDLFVSLIEFYRWIPGSKKWGWHGKLMKWQKDIIFDDYLDILKELLREFRKTGRYTLVEVRDGNTYVSIKLY